MVAFVYLGGGLSEPSNQVARIPPAFVMIKAMAIAVALRVCGVALFAIQVEYVGADTYVPGIERNRDPY